MCLQLNYFNNNINTMTVMLSNKVNFDYNWHSYYIPVQQLCCNIVSQWVSDTPKKYLKFSNKNKWQSKPNQNKTKQRTFKSSIKTKTIYDNIKTLICTSIIINQLILYAFIQKQTTKKQTKISAIIILYTSQQSILY